jgi:hypothetical protein
MANTTNFNWETPDDTDLVKDGAAAIRTLGSAIDTSLVDLKGGTTGQVLSKATNTDMDFTWVASDDSNAIQNAIIDAKGDLIVGTAADTPARLAVGTNGYVLTADSAETGGVKWAAVGGSAPASSTAYVATSQNTTSTSYTDLGTVVSTTLTTGTKALVIHGARFYNNTSDAEAQQSFAVSGATTVAADVKNSINQASTYPITFFGFSRAVLLTGLTAGSNTFTLKYKVDAGTGTFLERNILVIDMGS